MAWPCVLSCLLMTPYDVEGVEDIKDSHNQTLGDCLLLPRYEWFDECGTGETPGAGLSIRCTLHSIQ